MNRANLRQRDLPLSREEKFAAFLIYVRALEKAGLSPGFGRITDDDDGGVTLEFSLPNFRVREAILTAPGTVSEVAAVLAAQVQA